MAEFTANPHFEEYERLLIELHLLIAAEEGDTDLADEVRDRMDGPWRNLSDAERRRLDGLSADLYMLQGDEVYTHVESPARVQLLGIQAREAQETGDWDRVLRLLRTRPASAPRAAVAKQRCRAYSALGQWRPAALFAQYALTLDPSNRFTRYELLFALAQAGMLERGLESGLPFRVETEEDIYWLVQYVVLLMRADEANVRGLGRYYRHAATELARWLALARDVPASLRSYGEVALANCRRALAEPPGVSAAAHTAEHSRPTGDVQNGFVARTPTASEIGAGISPAIMQDLASLDWEAIYSAASNERIPTGSSPPK